jgi:hypothetical protein
MSWFALGRPDLRRRGNDDRVNTRQGILDVGTCRDAVLRLPAAVTDLSEPLIDADDFGYPGRGTKHADMPRTPVTHPDDADPDPARSRPHIPPPLPRPLGPSPYEASPITDQSGIPA